jgi:16S rRNA (guanine1516-N2)-methyltransferase
MRVINRVTYRGDTYYTAKKIADQYNLYLIKDPEKYSNCLIVSEEGISLRLEGYQHELYIDFCNNYYKYRSSSSAKEGILNACGVRAGKCPSILDLTGGWGRDGYILANAGCDVVLLERDPIVYILLNDGIRRLKEKTNYQIEVINIDALDYLQRETVKQEIIYYDPMRPNENNAAKNKKEIEILRKIITSNAQSCELAKLALTKANTRLVIKSGRYEMIDIDRVPTFSILGKNTKFDIYHKG